MNLLKLDHLAVACETLEDGCSFVEQLLGVPLAPGGEHAAMGTHNKLLSLGPEIYLEVIAINPDAKGPNRPRWFNLDNYSGKPRLTNWIVQTDDIQTALKTLGPGFGKAVHLTRADLCWQMAIPDSGILPWDGWAPALIEWSGDGHPAPRLPDQGIRLKSMVLHHPDAEDIAHALAPLMPRDTLLFEVDDTPGLSAIFDTPKGEKTLR